MNRFQIVSLLLILVISHEASPILKHITSFIPSKDKVVNLLKGLWGGAVFLTENEAFKKNEPADVTPKDGTIFDFIVIGAGTAGAAIASRLSENPSFNVLLIEAGSAENLVMDIPLLVHYLQLDENINWNYQTEPSDNFCLAMEDRSCAWPRGKVMGGSSVLNYMIATRGHPKDYDNWSELGNEGWAWKDVLPYFKKLETMGIREWSQNKEMHNTEGPVYIGYPPYHTPLADAFIEAGSEMGYEYIDYNGIDQVGFSYLQTTIKNGTRMSSNRAYLHPARNRKNLFVSKNSLATKLLFDNEENRVVGVEFIKRERTYRVRARKEVILSAGAIGSPQILMLSGIGPAQHLRKVGIDVVVDAPVGENLMDHIAYGGLVFAVNDSVSLTLPDVANPTKKHLNDFLNSRRGPWTVPGACEAIAFMDTDQPTNRYAYPNIELMFISASFPTSEKVRKASRISKSYWPKRFEKYEHSHTWTIYPMILRPKSKGKILLRDNNINSKPKIYPNYLSSKEDIKVLIAGIRTTLNLSKTVAMQKYRSELLDIPRLGCEKFEYDSDKFWECGLRALTFNIYHYSGTCKMGPKSDHTAVVDTDLKVHGIDGLRVADASIFPEIMSGHPNIPIFMIAEKVSDMIKQQWQN